MSPGFFPGLACLLLCACSRAPHPSAAVAPPPVFTAVGDTSEVLGTLPEPVRHPRPTVVTKEEDSGEEPAAEPGAPAPVDTAGAAPEAAPAKPADPADWVVQI